MANGINSSNDNPIPEQDIVNNIRLSRVTSLHLKCCGRSSKTAAYGIAAGLDFLLVCSYEENGENPELVMYKKR